MVTKYWFHGSVGRLEAEAALVAVELLERGLTLFVAHGNDLTVARLFLALDDDEVTIGDVLLDHRVARYAKRELVSVFRPFRKRELLVVLDRFNRLTGGDPADHLHPDRMAGRRVLE